MIIDNSQKKYTNEQLLEKGYTYSMYSLSMSNWYVAKEVDVLLAKAEELNVTDAGIYLIQKYGFEFINDISKMQN